MTMLVSRWKSLAVVGVGAIVLAGASIAFGQQSKKPAVLKDAAAPSATAKPEYGEFNMSTTLGSFKMIEYNDDHQPEGHLEMSFSGTVLIDTDQAFKHNRGLKTSVKFSGNVRQEVSYHGRNVYHGNGTIVVDGGWHALQFFGRDLKAKFVGYSVFRLAGEFDKNLETGFFWYSDGKKIDWGTGGNQPTCPRTVFGVQKPKVEISGKGG